MVADYKTNSTLSCWNPFGSLGMIWSHKNLIYQLIKRDLQQRYKDSCLGLIWTLITPILYLLIYTFVFNVIMKARWGIRTDEGPMEFALGLFCGLILWNLFGESATVAPSLIVNNPTYVTKTVFPLEILPVITVGSALIRGGIGILVLLVGMVCIGGAMSWKLLFLVLPLTGMVFFALGIAWFLSALGVFLRDTSHVVFMLVTFLFFLTPIVYPLSRVPDSFRFAIYLNPFTHLVESARCVTIWNTFPDWSWLGLSLGISVVMCHIGYLFFEKNKKAFADVL